MGLDQYGIARKGSPVRKENTYVAEDLEGNEREITEYYHEWEDSKELAYWRKHPSLQGYMEALYYKKGGKAETFNCEDVVLTLEDLDDMEQTLDENALPETVGFFFGENSDEHYAQQDRQFIEDARAAIAEGYTVVYSSWW